MSTQTTDQRRLIGWRSADYTMETDDLAKAQNWSGNIEVLPVFEGDPNTRLSAQPAAPQEAVPAFYLHSSDWNSVLVPMTPHRDVRAYRHGFDHSDPEDLVPVYAAPVTAAPTLDAELAQDRMSELCELERDVLDSLPAVYYMDPPDGGSVSLGEQVKRMAEDAALWRKHSTTPAAPGIYLQAFRALACFGEEFAFSAERQPQSRVVYSQAKRLLALIDASPKGGSDADDWIWREGWALAYSGAANLYGDDSELQDNSTQPFIDWRRDSVETIRDKITERGNRAIAAMQATSAEGESDAQPMFYIQDTRSFVGNCPVWWAHNGAGYVTRIDEAGRFTEQEAIAQNRARGTDVPWPCVEIDKLGRITVDMQHMRPRRERLAELATSAEVGE